MLSYSLAIGLLGRLCYDNVKCVAKTSALSDGGIRFVF